MTNKLRGYLIQDIAIIALSVFAAIFLVKTQILAEFLASTHRYELLSSFIAGVFFTSILTTAPAIVAVTEIVQVQSPFSVAFFGAIGAMLGMQLQ